MEISIPLTDLSMNTVPKPRFWQRWLKHLLYILTMVVDVIGLSLTAISIGWIVLGEGNIFTWHFSSLLPSVIVLSPFFALIGLIIRRRRWVLFHIVPTLLLGVLYGGFLIPRPVIVSANATNLRVMTFNTQFRVNEAPEIVNIILEADVDVVALQELSEPTAAYFAEHLIEEYPYQITHTWGTSVKGKGFLSRYPLTNERFDTFNGWTYYLRAQIEFADEIITLVNTHPSPPRYGINFNTNARSQGIDWIMDTLATESGAVIILGDFNTTDQSADYHQITAEYADSFREVGVGLGRTFPDVSRKNILQAIPPLIRIDYIFHSEHLQAVSTEVWHTSAGSDHRPVVATLTMLDNT
jgi:endonuclease/exonuclease/phosphatase (EEP) superfamily protein YafD